MQSLSYKIPPETFVEFFNSLLPLCASTGQGQLPSFGDELSLISPSLRASSKKKYSFLCLDVGGTRSKACIKTYDTAADPIWKELLDIDNNDLKNDLQAKGLASMTMELGKRISNNIKSEGLDSSFNGIAIVWSNKIQSFKLSGSISGIGAKVLGSKDGQAYRKGEWWNHDIEDGDDISSYFLSGLKANGIESPILVISNDTVFTAKALAGASAGVVASTGANATILAIGNDQFFNSECGGKIQISKELLRLKSLSACLPNSNTSVKIEDVCAGRGLPQIFRLLIEDLLSSGQDQLKKLSQSLEQNPLSAPDLGQVLKTNSFADLNSKGIDIGQSQELSLTTLKDLVSNAGAFCAVLIFLSVANQLKSAQPLLVALDSSQARFMPGYRESLDQHLAFLNAKLSAKVSYELIQPKGNISVPLQGAANTVEDFLSKP